MRKKIKFDPAASARVLVWVALSGFLLWWLRWGSDIIEITSYYRIRRSVPYIWNQFYENLPDVGNAQALDSLYWIALAVMTAGVLALLWLALSPDSDLSDATLEHSTTDELIVEQPIPVSE